MKKLVKIFSILFGVMSSLFVTTNVHAVASRGDIISGKYVSGPYYVVHEKQDGHHMWLQAQFITRSSDGQFVYCVQPYFTIKEDNSYNVTTEDIASIANISTDNWNTISKIAYYGYGYKDNNYDHTAEKWYIASQMLIWNLADPSIDSYFTNSLKGTRNDSILKSEQDEIMKLVNEHIVLPDFGNIPSEMLLGETITLNDKNNVLKKYDIDNISNGNVSKNDNQLNITATNPGSISFNINKKNNIYDNPVQLYYAVDSQNVIRRGYLDPIDMNVRINVKGGKITLNKLDSETKSLTPLGDASLSNAVYGIYTENGNLVETITTQNGIAKSSSNLAIGKYYLQEISAGKGYYVDKTKYTFSISKVALDLNLSVYENVIKGKIKIVKHDSDNNSCSPQGEATLFGAKYGIYNSKNELVETLIIGNDCSATSSYLPYGNYKIKELESSVGYYLDTNIYNANITSDNVVSVTSKEKVITTKVKVSKNDSETKTCNPQGDAKLSGAKYGIYDINNNLVDTLVTTNDCTVISKELPYGHYTVKELEPSEGYYLDKQTYSVNISNNNVIEITSYEDVIKNYISILKQYDYVDGQTTFLNAESNINFEIYNSKGNLYSTIKTDKNGYASINLPYGVWKFHQVNTTTGYEKIYDFYITVSKTSELEQYYNILNNSLSAYLQVLKIDSDTGKQIALANTTFRILNVDTNQYVTQYVGGKVYDKYTTDETGKMITYLKLSSGNYKLIEVSSPKGYLIRPEGYLFTIGNDTHFSYTTYGAFITIEYKNSPIKGQIEINKSGEDFIIEDGSFKYDSIKLNNIEFNIYAREDILSSDKNHLYYNKGDLVDTITTNKNGYAISKKLPLGKYYIVEVKTLDGYILDTKEYDIELTELDNRTAIVYKNIELNNILKKGDLEFTKTDLTTSVGIKDTKVEIYTDKDELIYSGITDKDGNIKIKNLVVGKYYIIETEASTGYKLTDEKVYFEITKNGEIVKANMTNEKKKGTLEFTKVDLSTDEPLPNTLIEIYSSEDKLVFSGRTNEEGKIVIEKLEYGKYYILEKEAPVGYTLNTEKMYFEILEDGEIIKSIMKDKKIISTIKIHKVDDSNNPLEGVTIGIYDLDNNLIYSGITDSNGDIEYDLEYGNYYFQEIETIEGYNLNDEKVYFEITKDGEIIQHTLVNDKIIVKVPNTEENNYIIPITTILISGATIIVIYETIKKKRK